MIASNSGSFISGCGSLAVFIAIFGLQVSRERDWVNRTFDAHTHRHKHKIGIVPTYKPCWTLAGNARHMVELEQFMILLVLSVVWMRTHYRCAWLLQILCNSVEWAQKRERKKLCVEETSKCLPMPS